MRGAKRSVVALLVVASTFSPPSANADGGAYLEFDRTYYLPGEVATVEAYVRVPTRKLSLFERGPFFLFALPEGSSLIEGRPIPSGAVRLATLTIDREGPDQELSASFPVPQLPWGSHQVEVCNDPCTLAGFREPLTGGFSIVATARERTLLRENGRLDSGASLLRREVRRAERRIDDLRQQLTWGISDRERLAAKIERLERTLSAARAELTDGSARPAFDPWRIAGLALIAILGAAVLRARRRDPTEHRPAATLASSGDAGGHAPRPQPRGRGRAPALRR